MEAENGKPFLCAFRADLKRLYFENFPKIILHQVLQTSQNGVTFATRFGQRIARNKG